MLDDPAIGDTLVKKVGGGRRAKAIWEIPAKTDKWPGADSMSDRQPDEKSSRQGHAMSAIFAILVLLLLAVIVYPWLVNHLAHMQMRRIAVREIGVDRLSEETGMRKEEPSAPHCNLRSAAADTVRDRFWAWAHEAAVYNGSWGLPGKSRITPVEGTHYLGVPNVILIRYGGLPPVENDAQYIVPFRSLKRVMWSVHGSVRAVCGDSPHSGQPYLHRDIRS